MIGAVSRPMPAHFDALSSCYRSVRTTDPAPVRFIARALGGGSALRGADVGSGAGRYVLLMFECIADLSLACVDASPGMLGELEALLRAHRVGAFDVRHGRAEALALESGGYDFVSSFNAVHHFDLAPFLAGARDGLRVGGSLFVYTRLPEHNARSVWGRHFPGFVAHETRLRPLGALHGAIEATPGLRFLSATCFRYARQASAARLVEQAWARHYSTFALYEDGAFETALASFCLALDASAPGPVEWQDENVLVHAVRDP